MDEQKHGLHVVPGGRVRSTADVSELGRLRAEIDARNRQETAVAELGQAALTGVDRDILLGQACALVELTLGIGHCRILELDANGRMRLLASIGSNESFARCTADAEEDDSIGMLTLLSDGSVLFSDLVEETRFRSGHLRQYHGVRSGAGVTIRTQNGPFGVLLTYASEARPFADYEVAFLQSTANILGEAISRSRTEDAWRKSERRLRQVIASTLDAVVTIDATGTVIDWNPQAEETFGITARDAVGRPLPMSIVPTRLQALFARLLDSYRSGRRKSRSERRVQTAARRASGEEFPVEITLDPVGSGDAQTVTAFIRDISEQLRAQRHLEKSEKRFRSIVEKSYSGIALLDASLRFIFTSSSTHHLLGYTEEELLGRSLVELVHPRERDNAMRIFETLKRASSGEAQGELRFQHKDGSWLWLEGFGQNMLADSNVGAIVLNYRDVTQRKATEKKLEYQSYYDTLTGLPNRLLFRDRVVNAVAKARRYKSGLAVLYLDLDHFKIVNDGLGHSFGDRLIADVSRRLQECIRASDTISRTGGDEFSILLPDVTSSEAVASIARKILASLDRPFVVDQREFFVTASMGVSIHPADGDDVETLFRCADAALHRAKELGRNQSQLFTASMNARYEHRLQIEQSLHYAVERGEMEVWYQPICEGPSGRVESVEALIRWHDPRRGLIEPSEFINLAEETGLIVPIGEWVLRNSVRQLREWREVGIDHLRVAVNISVPQFQQPDFVELVKSVLAENSVAPDLLQLEITESVAIQDVGLTMNVLRELRAHGVRIAIDDFGTGQSSLIYLKQFPIDAIKIDKEFVRDVAGDETAAAIVSYVINLAHTLRLQVVAEGVETEAQYVFLRHCGCELMQGYLFSRPLPATQIQPLLTGDRMRELPGGSRPL
ncbi:MAG: EAL domain-containing protein [Acidobacteriota bacterium]